MLRAAMSYNAKTPAHPPPPLVSSICRYPPHHPHATVILAVASVAICGDKTGSAIAVTGW